MAFSKIAAENLGGSALPNLSGASLTTLNATNISSGTLNAARYSGSVVGDEIDSWSYNTSTATTGATLTTNWERTTGYFNEEGTGMSCNNTTGVFTFPSTGFYLVTYKCVFNSQNTTTYVQNGIVMNGGQVTCMNHIDTTNDSQHQPYGEALYKVDNTSTKTIYFNTNFGGNSNQVLGAANDPYTGVTFLKLRAA